LEQTRRPSSFQFGNTRLYELPRYAQRISIALDERVFDLKSLELPGTSIGIACAQADAQRSHQFAFGSSLRPLQARRGQKAFDVSIPVRELRSSPLTAPELD